MAELKADITANEVGAYNKAEADKRFQPVGKYQAEGYSYAKRNLILNINPKAIMLLREIMRIKAIVIPKQKSDGKYQPKGNYQASGDYATNTNLKNELNFDGNIAQATGTQRFMLLAKKAATDAFQPKGNYQPKGNICISGCILYVKNGI